MTVEEPYKIEAEETVSLHDLDKRANRWHGIGIELSEVVDVETCQMAGLNPQENVNARVAFARRAAGDQAALSVSQRNIGYYDNDSAAPHFVLEAIALSFSFDDVAAARRVAKTLPLAEVRAFDTRPGSEEKPVRLSSAEFVVGM